MHRKIAGMRFLIALFLAAAPVPAIAQIISGPATAIDGDSLEMTGVRIRLFGIDAVEGQQTCQRNGSSWACGQEAADQLSAMLREKDITCEQRDRDRYGRIVAICTADGFDLGEAMVLQGYAVALSTISNAYVDTEDRARAAKLGIWSAQFELPAAYRNANPLVTKSGPQSALRSTPQRSAKRAWRAPEPYSNGCVIKGNRNRKGQWIYHLPGMPYYDVTRPEEIFCTEAQAVAAGYRRAIVRQ